MAGVMLLARKWSACLFVLAVICLIPSLSAVVVEGRIWHGKQIQCFHGGAWAFRAKACGTVGYERVLAGTVQSVTALSDTDRRLQIKPDEVFLGDSNGIVTATVNQACLTPNDPEIKVGDKWLFYLRPNRSFRADGKPTHDAGELEIPFDGPSKPLPRAQEAIAKLRYLARLTDSGIVNGKVMSMGTLPEVSNHKIVAKRAQGGAQYSALADTEGDFEFDPLPVGSYEVTANSVDGLWAGEPRKLDVRSAQCTQASFMLQTDGRISGRIGSPDGKPFTVHPWIQIVSVDDQHFTSTYVDANGDFEATGVEPGRYVIGIDILNTDHFEARGPDYVITSDLRDSSETRVKTPIYYPGVRTQEKATVIELGRAEKRTNINFKLPPEYVLKPYGLTSGH
jgi:hypothetical protein